MFFKAVLCCIATFVVSIYAQTNKGLEIGFPQAWNGDQFHNESVPTQGIIPPWLNGYFLLNSCASYGNRSDLVGKKLLHMFDAFGAVSSWKIDRGAVAFSASYYPTRMYKIWNFYDRDMSRSTVAWNSIRTPYNVASAEMWNHITGDNSFPNNPHVDFWKIGNTVLGGTEIVKVGMQFNVPSLSNFTAYPFKETNDFFKYKSSMIPLNMPIHERVEPDGSIYAAIAAYDPTKNKMYQVVFHVSNDGTRTIEGIFEHGTYDPSKCMSNGTYTGDKKVLAGYMHGITSTRKYIILPVTSVIFNPCKLAPLLSNMKLNNDLPDWLKQNPNPQEYASDVPIRFLIFDKIQKRFISEQPIMAKMDCSISHQFNAYEDQDGTLVADMIGSTGDPYDKLTVDQLLKDGGGMKEVNLYRFRINPTTKTIQSSNILADRETMFAEFPSYNRDYIEKKYKFGYIIQHPYKAGSKIVKIDMDARKIVAEFSAPGSRAKDAVFREPWFVSRPGAKDEDDGVVLTIAGYAESKSTTLYVLEGKSLTMVGQAEIPTFIPLGFHNRFYSFKDLGLSR